MVYIRVAAAGTAEGTLYNGVHTCSCSCTMRYKLYIRVAAVGTAEGTLLGVYNLMTSQVRNEV